MSSPDYICLGKNGDIVVKWHDNAYAQPEAAKVNVVKNAYDNFIEGVFTDETTALSIAKEWFKQESIDKINSLKEEIKRLESEL